MLRCLVIACFSATFVLATGAANAYDPAEVIAAVRDVSWDLTPAHVTQHVDPAKTVVWAGQVEDVRVYRNATEETAIEWFARHLSFDNPSPSGIAEPLRLHDAASGHFVVTLSLPEVPVEEAKLWALEKMGSPKFIVVSGEPVSVHSWGDTPAVYVRAAHVTVSDEFAVKISKPTHSEAAPTATPLKTPLIREPNAYSYTFAVPDGWTYSFEQAREFGLPLVFFALGSDFHKSNAVVYVNEICSTGCLARIDDEIQSVLARAQQNSPQLTISVAEPILTNSGVSAEVRILEGLSDPRQAREALSFIAHPDAIVLVVLSTKDPTTWESDFASYRELIAGHEFFTCSTPNLRVWRQDPAASD